MDIGCGCGALALASRKAEAKSVLCNDIDHIAMAAVLLNFKLNQLEPPELSVDNLIGRSHTNQPRNASIFLGDMFYDEKMAEKILSWCLANCQIDNEIFIGDPGRWGLEFIKDYITQVAEYDIMDDDCGEFRSACVFKFVPN
jgi:predicted nicotinamide N-methyase